MKNDSQKRFERGAINCAANTQAAQWGRFNSRMAHVYATPARMVAVFGVVPNKRRKATVKVIGFEYQSGFDLAECQAKENAHTAKGVKRGFTWRAGK